MWIRTARLASAAGAALLATSVVPALGADAEGLTVASYVEKCAFKAGTSTLHGWRKNDWCISIGGKVTFETSFGTTLTFGADPYAGNVVTMLGTGSYWSGFSLTGAPAIFVERNDDKFVMQVLGGLSLTVGAWTFAADRIVYTHTEAGRRFTLGVWEPGRRGWSDPVTTAALAGPWPDLEFGFRYTDDATRPNVTVAWNGNLGQRADTDPIPDFTFVTFGGDLTLTFERKEAANLTLRGDFDRVDAWGDGDQVVNAFGVQAMIATDAAGDGEDPRPTFGVGAMYARNYGGYLFPGTETAMYRYQEMPLGNYWGVIGTTTIPASATTSLTFTGTFADGPLPGMDDAVVALTGEAVFAPANASPLSITASVEHLRMLGGQLLNATAGTLSIGAAF